MSKFTYLAKRLSNLDNICIVFYFKRYSTNQDEVILS